MVRSPKRPHPALLVMLLLLAIVAFCFYRGQNLAGHVGGAISIPKIFWLNYAICVFMVVPGFMWRDQRLDPALRFIFGCQFGNWLVRGAVELVLMYGLHAWIPPYGIYHGIFTLVMLMTLRYRYRSVLATASTHVDQNAKRFLCFSMLTSMCEIYFAWHFYMAANFDTRTTWFASGTPAYIYINRVTAVVDFLAYTGLFMTVLRFYRPGALRLRHSQLSP